MQPEADGKTARERLLEGVIDARFRSQVGISRDPGGDQLLINIGYEELKKVLKESSPHHWLEFDSFIWTGSRREVQTVFKFSVRADQIIAITQYTEAMWDQYVTDQQARIRQAMGQGVPTAMPGIRG